VVGNAPDRGSPPFNFIRTSREDRSQVALPQQGRPLLQRSGHLIPQIHKTIAVSGVTNRALKQGAASRL
jgi:hypothetical protein